jgi:hypothetical protein
MQTAVRETTTIQRWTIPKNTAEDPSEERETTHSTIA